MSLGAVEQPPTNGMDMLTGFRPASTLTFRQPSTSPDACQYCSFCADGVPEIRRRTDTKSYSGLPRIEHIHSHAVKVSYIPSRDGQTVHKGRGCDESVSIGARVRHVKRRASLGYGGINR